MKCIFTLFSLFLLTALLEAQVVAVDYDLQLNTDVPSVLTSSLQVDTRTNSSFYTVLLSTRRWRDKDPKTADGRTIFYRGASEGEVCYIPPNSDSLFARQSVFRNNFLIKEKIPTIKWNLSDPETKTIGDYTAKKATAYFRGRNYTAWYTPEIPVNRGPFKFHGLPGLILHIADDTQTFVWHVKKIETANKNYEPNAGIFEKKSWISIQDYAQEKFGGKPSIQSTDPVLARLPRELKIQSVRRLNPNKRFGMEIKFEWEEEDEQE